MLSVYLLATKEGQVDQSDSGIGDCPMTSPNRVQVAVTSDKAESITSTSRISPRPDFLGWLAGVERGQSHIPNAWSICLHRHQSQDGIFRVLHAFCYQRWPVNVSNDSLLDPGFRE